MVQYVETLIRFIASNLLTNTWQTSSKHLVVRLVNSLIHDNYNFKVALMCNKIIKNLSNVHFKTSDMIEGECRIIGIANWFKKISFESFLCPRCACHQSFFVWIYFQTPVCLCPCTACRQCTTPLPWQLATPLNCLHGENWLHPCFVWIFFQSPSS